MEEKILKVEYKNHHRDLTYTFKLKSFQRGKAIKHRVFRENRMDTWNKSVNSLNSITPTKEVWNKFRKEMETTNQEQHHHWKEEEIQYNNIT